MLQIRSQTRALPLKKGDEVITVAVSSVIDNEETLLEGLEVLKSWGLVCRPPNVCNRHWGYLAGDDPTRFTELHLGKPAPLMAFARGGWGAARLLEKAQPWKNGWLLGFSDVSAILLARLTSGFDGAIHGPLVTSLAKEPSWSKQRLQALLFGKSLPELYGDPWFKGISTGPLIVTNLTVGTHLIGSKHLPDLKGAILVFEDIGEAPYRIDRMLTQWRLAGLLQVIAGIGFGTFEDCKTPKEIQPEKTFELEDVLKERCNDLQIPVVGNLPIGHCCGNAALPLGRIATLDGNKGSLKV